jgi:hypothetical protein
MAFPQLHIWYSNEWEEIVKGSVHGLINGTIPECSWKGHAKPWVKMDTLYKKLNPLPPKYEEVLTTQQWNLMQWISVVLYTYDAFAVKQDASSFQK